MEVNADSKGEEKNHPSTDQSIRKMARNEIRCASQGGTPLID